MTLRLRLAFAAAPCEEIPAVTLHCVTHHPENTMQYKAALLYSARKQLLVLITVALQIMGCMLYLQFPELRRSQLKLKNYRPIFTHSSVSCALHCVSLLRVKVWEFQSVAGTPRTLGWACSFAVTSSISRRSFDLAIRRSYSSDSASANSKMDETERLFTEKVATNAKVCFVHDDPAVEQNSW